MFDLEEAFHYLKPIDDDRRHHVARIPCCMNTIVGSQKPQLRNQNCNNSWQQLHYARSTGLQRTNQFG